MIREFRLPDLGEGLTESEIVSWHVHVGDSVTLNQIIADVETAKAVVELPSPYAGVITQLHAQPGTVISVGAPIVSFDVGPLGSAEPDPASLPAGMQANAPDDGGTGREATLVGYGAAPENRGRPVRRARRSGPAPLPPAPSAPSARGLTTPPVRKLARDLGVDLEAVTPSGAGGTVVRADVLGAAGSAQSYSARTVPGSPGSDGAVRGSQLRVPINTMRRKTAAAMVASAFTAPQVTVFLTVDATATMELLDRIGGHTAFSPVRVTVVGIVAKMFCQVLGRHRRLNARWEESAGEIVEFQDINLGIAAATPRGLLVPNIKAAQKLSLSELAEEIAALTEAARAGKTRPDALSGGTISITNVGVFGVDAGTPILNPGEAAILGLGAIRRRPWEHRGEIALRSVVTLSLTFDHRVLDGEQAARFLAELGAVLEDPGLAATWA